MIRKYELIIDATNLNSNSEFGSWRGIKQYLIANRSFPGREADQESESQFKEKFRTGLPRSFSDAVRTRLARSLEAAFPRLERFGPYGFEFFEELRRALRDSRKSQGEDSPNATEIASIIRAVFGEDKVTEPESVSDLRAAIASSTTMSLQVSKLRLGSIESELLLCGYEELQKHLKLDILGFDAFVQACLVSAVYDLYSLHEGAVSVTVTSLEADQAQTAVTASLAPQETASPSQPPKVALDDYLAGWAKKMFAAAIFPIVLAIVVGGAIVFQFDKVDASRQKLAEQQLQFLKQEAETKKAKSDEDIKHQSELANQWKLLFEALKKEIK